MFFWLVYGNGERKMFNINCRALILMDHISNTCFRESQIYVEKQIRQINASRYNEFMEQQVLDQLVKYIEGKDGEPGYFISPLPLKPFEINSVRDNRDTADEHNEATVHDV